MSNLKVVKLFSLVGPRDYLHFELLLRESDAAQPLCITAGTRLIPRTQVPFDGQNGSKWVKMANQCDWVLKTILILSFHFYHTVVDEMFLYHSILYPSFLPSTFISSPLTNERSWQFECACK